MAQLSGDQANRRLGVRILSAQPRSRLTAEPLGGRTAIILIDSGVGNHKPRPSRSLWNMLDSDRFEIAQLLGESLPGRGRRDRRMGSIPGQANEGKFQRRTMEGTL